MKVMLQHTLHKDLSQGGIWFRVPYQLWDDWGLGLRISGFRFLGFESFLPWCSPEPSIRCQRPEKP